jgi:predicted phosphodiesterase
VADDFYAVHKVVNTKFLALHGDKIPMYLSLPFYGIDRRSLKWKQSLPDWDILVMGHFHSASFLQPSGLPIFINGTVCSDSRYVAQWIGVREIAEQWTMFVGEKYGVTAMHKIDLMREDG